MAVEQNTTKSSNSIQALPWTSNWQSPVKTETKIALGEISGEINNIWVSGYITCYFNGTTTNPKVVEFTNFQFNSRLKDSFYVVNKEWAESEIKEHIDAELLFGEDHKLYLNQLLGCWAGSGSGGHINGTITINNISYVNLESNFKYQNTPNAEKIFYNYVTTDTADFDDIFARIGASDACCYDCEDLFGAEKYKNNNKNLKYLSIDDTANFPWIKKAEDISYYNINRRYTITQDIENKAIIKGTTPRPFRISTSGDNINVTGPAKELGHWIYGDYSEKDPNYAKSIYVERKKDTNGKWGFCFSIDSIDSSTKIWKYARDLGLTSLPWTLTCIAWGGGGGGSTGWVTGQRSRAATGSGGGGGGAGGLCILDFTKEDIFVAILGKYGNGGTDWEEYQTSGEDGGNTILKVAGSGPKIGNGIQFGGGGGALAGLSSIVVVGGSGGEITNNISDNKIRLLSSWENKTTELDGGSGGCATTTEVESQSCKGTDRLQANKASFTTDTKFTIAKSNGGRYAETDFAHKKNCFGAGGGGGASFGEGGKAVGAHLKADGTIEYYTDGLTTPTPGYLGGGGAGSSYEYNKITVYLATSGGRGGIIFLY